VAITVLPEHAQHPDTRVEFRTLASSAPVVFSNALVLSLAALVPGATPGWWALAGSVTVRTLNYVVIGDLTAGIGRAWQLASMGDTDVLASVRTLALGETPEPGHNPSSSPGPGPDSAPDAPAGGDDA
jgi:hypothetical protein